METPVTKRFGRYEVLAELGRGAMGVVYRARDPQIDRTVAIKTVSLWGQEPEEEKEFRLRFMNEAQAAGRLHHSGIVGVFDVGENPENEDPYIVLEYVAGEPLNRVLSREKKLSLPIALQLAIEIAEALDYAHAQGVVHRDIKPANILVTSKGHAKIADFGIAKLNLAHFTLPGRVLGTPAYMAPEQLSGEGVDGRSDLFSLGVILYAMVTGHSPFQGNSATTVCFKVANREPVAASALDMSLPPQLDAVINKAMAKDPSERYQRGSELAEDLRVLLQQVRPGTTTSSLQAATATRSGTTSALRPMAATNSTVTEHVTAVADAKNLVGRILQKAPLRDLILGAATIVLLVIVGAQMKLLVGTSKSAGNASASEGAPPPTPAAADLPKAHEAIPASSPAATRVLTHTAPAKRVAAKTPAPKPPTPKPPTQTIVVPSSTLDVAIQHQFKDATLYVWIDDKLALTRPLHGGAQKKLVVFNGVRGMESESIKVPAGSHTLRFRALSTDQTVDLSKTVSAEFVGGDTKSLQLTVDKHNLRINWE